MSGTDRENGVRSAAGRPARKTYGFAPADMSGTRSIPEAFAPRASTSGLKPSAYRAVDGRHTRCGMRSEAETSLPLFFPQTPYYDERIATLSFVDQPALLQCLDAAGIRG